MRARTNEMNLGYVLISRAEAGDVDGILALAERNAPDRGGELSVRSTREDIVASISASLAVVAHQNGEVIGFVLTHEKRGPNPPIIEAMLRAYAGSHNAYVYGPVCVDESARGLGIAALMFAELRKLLPGREGILFIKASNEPSLRSHRKMGMQEVGEFTFQGTRLIIFAYNYNA
jgi:GNAT superfamily N-acetyltransferase